MNHIKIDFERIVSNIDCNIFGGYMEIGPSGRGCRIWISVMFLALIKMCYVVI